MKKFFMVVIFAFIFSSVFAKTWRRESMTEEVGYVSFNHVIVYNDSNFKFEANYVTIEPVSILEFYDTYINLSGLRNYGVRIYYDMIPRDKLIIVHVAEDRGIEE